MILVPAVFLGLLAGWFRSRLSSKVWRVPELKYAWLVLVFIIPQWLVFALPISRDLFSKPLAASCLVLSQVGLLLFSLLNRHLTGMWIFSAGLILNLLVIISNGGFMPVSTLTLSHLIPATTLASLTVGERISLNSKDILLAPNAIKFSWLADQFISPSWFPWRFIYSIGDVLIALGVFLLLTFDQNLQDNKQERKSLHVNTPII